MMTPEMMDRDREELGRTIRQRRSDVLGLTEEELADLSACTAKDVSSLEAGNPVCDYSTIRRICDVLGIPEGQTIIYDPGVIF